MKINLSEQTSLLEGTQYLAQEKYIEAIAFYQQSIEADPTTISNSWYLCLALLLDGQESQALSIWSSVLEQALIEQVDTWTKGLVEVLTKEAISREAASDFQLAHEMRQYASVAYNLARLVIWKRVKGYKFSTTWFIQALSIWEQHLISLANKPSINILEIGSWEGMSACWLLDNILTHESSTLTCIDTFEGSIEHKVEYEDSYINSIEEKFDFNISQTGVPEKVRKIVGNSQDVLRTLPINHYDMIYIDGSHIASDVLVDAVLSWGLVKVGGIIVFDDYNFSFNDIVEASHNTKIGIDAFLTVFYTKIKIIYQGEQILIKKICP
ncbi:MULTISPECIES: class I SAM-dependent methyltransferase [unclassified Nostoc]|uniref:class I SAM-dependent methyltransferase n=1 Tax=unclassified Nostoc TaxID=2593658 RepID=UPI0013D7ACBA|nr:MULTISPECIES: class I SAM-dependent methyltransferase [unclassified Nostoc]MBE9001847.1 class I SAM-dependent methyltransferase [Nostoc sp. LEGE 12447]NEU77741.1 class I SAM-dependent methyltransferase [Nostoc sp. UIC 10630]QID92152.1 SAM-dependent methyltransferase [Nostoc sp. UIC 10630]